jgi:hypothetical protein
MKTLRIGLLAAALFLSSCAVLNTDGRATAEHSLDHVTLGIPVSVDFRPDVDGFSFANFNSDRYPQRFDADALIAVVGAGPRVCVDGIADPCVLTTEAAEFIDTVEAARAAGHCEGMIVLAAVRYTRGMQPANAVLPDDERTINAVIRAFATIFLPEVQAEARSWITTSLADTVENLARALQAGTLDYGMGIYRPDGGHEVLPYAIDYPRDDLARIWVYDSNWPGVERYVEIDLATETWRFSFAADDQENDAFAWEGGHEDLDLNSIAVRVAALEARGVDFGTPSR